jgi:methionyl aminopeptidase
MSIETDADWRGLKAAGRVASRTLAALAPRVHAGVSTGELDRVAAAVFERAGARSAPALMYGFPGTVLISVNDEIVHGVPGTRELRPGDVVKLDVTVEKDGYVADAARTVIVGRGTQVSRRLVSCAEAAFRRAIRAARPGLRVSEIGRAVSSEVGRRGFSVIRGLTGHGVGRTIHEPPEVPNYYDPRQRDVLTEGLVLAVEPLVSAGSPDVVADPDGWTIRTADGSVAAHHENTVVITRRGPILLTAA